MRHLVDKKENLLIVWEGEKRRSEIGLIGWKE